MLADEWADGPRTAVGMMTSGFPNLLMLAATERVGLDELSRAIEDGVEWVSDLIEPRGLGDYTDRGRASSREGVGDGGRPDAGPPPHPQQQGLVHRVRELAGREGKPRYQAYFGGAPRYRTRVASIAEAGYPGFDLR